MMQLRSSGYTMSMWRKRNNWIFILFLLPFAINAQLTHLAFSDNKLLDVSVKKMGPYVGWQRGKYNVGELGVEAQWKKIKLSKSKTHAINTGFNYNYTHNVLGYDLGYWIKPSRLGLTYGGRLVFKTNFTESRMGISPTIGYKIFGFHLQTGYNLLSSALDFEETNTFFISLRFTLINERDVDMKMGSWFKKKKD